GYAPDANAPAAPAAAAPPIGPPAVAPPPPSIDAGMTLVPARGTDRIEAGLELAKNDARDADADKAAALDHRSRAKAELEVKKREISTVDARIKLADKEKNESGKAALGAEKKVAEREKELLERREDLAKAEVDVADKRAAFARASQTALESELELARRRDERSRLAPGPEATHLDQVILELARK